MASIAIVGMACEYADARSPEELWENVLAERRAFRRIPSERLSLDDYFSPDPAAPDTTYATEAAVIEGYEFDRTRFRVAGDTFRATDMAHWLALDVASRALANAGFEDGTSLPRDATGVFVGNTLTGEFSRAALLRLRWPYVRRVLESVARDDGWPRPERVEWLTRIEELFKAPFPPVGEESLAGGLSNTIAGRICNHFDLMGGGYTVDGACAASLLAVITACSSLSAGDVDVALAGGVDLSLDPFELVGFAKAGALARGPMRVFDAHSDGFIPGEGCGFLILMREDDAMAARRRCRAVIRGWGVSSDGSGGITRPEFDGQLLAIQRAYRRAGLDPGNVGYIEAHGTGTNVGDLTELRVLGHVARRPTGSRTPVAIGSIKANIGHTKAAAGLAGMVKATLALEAQIIPPTTGCETPHPEVSQQASIRLMRSAERWPADLPLRAGVSAMGFGGINTHLILESTTRRRRPSLGPKERVLMSSAQDCELILLEASTPLELASRIDAIRAIAPRLSRAELTDLAAAQGMRTSSGTCRAALVVSTPSELAMRLDAIGHWIDDGLSRRVDANGASFCQAPVGTARIGFLFPGQASPVYPDGGALARRFAVARDSYASRGLRSGDPHSTAVAQPAVVTASLAGLAVLKALGLTAKVAIGHSLGELTAFHWGGAFTADTLLRLAERRGEMMSRSGATGGAMVNVALGPDGAASLAAGTTVEVAAYNAPQQTVLTGPAGEIERVIARARAVGARTTKLPVSCAFHSALLAGVATGFGDLLASEAVAPLTGSVVSTVTGQRLTGQDDLQKVLVRQITSPVRFTEAVLAVASGVDLFVEVGPGSILTGLVSEIAETPALAIDAGGRSLRGLLQAVGAAFVLGADVARDALFTQRFARPFDASRRPVFFANPCELAPACDASDPEEPVEATVAMQRGALVVAGRHQAPRNAPRTPARSGGATPSATPAVSAGHGTAPVVDVGARRDAMSALDTVRELVGSRAELPSSTIRDDHRLLSDLHLNSITVGRIVVDAARHLQAPVPIAPMEYADATIAQVATALEESRRHATTQEGGPRSRQLDGVDSWVRAFSIALEERPLPGPVIDAPSGSWQIFSHPRHPLRAALEEKLRNAPGSGVVVCLPPTFSSDRDAAILLDAGKAALAARGAVRFIVVQHGYGGTGFARTLHMEAPEITAVVVNVPLDHPDVADWVAHEALAGSGVREVFRDADGGRREPVLRLLPLTTEPRAGAIALGPGDVMLVTGGGKGIAAECAFSLARETGVRLALVGRSSPVDDDGLAANLTRLRAAGITFEYLTADVSDGAAIQAAVREAENALGPITAILHAAGSNVPTMTGALTEDAWAHAIAPKVHGLTNVLHAVNVERLRLLVTFGSIIARTGMRGEAHYALANEWSRDLTERFQAEHPDCRCLTLEWSVWAGIGMGQRLGRLDSLVGQGITPIPVDQGTTLLRSLLGQKPLPSCVVVTGRLPAESGLRPERRDLPLVRFLERPRSFYPGVELIADAELSTESDLYLDDHVLNGDRLLPAVIELEAMAQSCVAAGGWSGPPTFENVELLRPIIVPDGEKVILRTAALVRGPDRVDVVIRSSSTGFQVDHCRTTCRRVGEQAPADRLQKLRSIPRDHDGIALDPEANLYGDLLFHRGRFKRVSRYTRLTATECVAELTASNEAWFGRYLPHGLLLGDPGMRDAAIHAIQACVPYARLLPASIERVVSLAALPSDRCWVVACERQREGQWFVYDLVLEDANGVVCEQWIGLRLRSVETIDASRSWPVALLGPYLERRFQELVPHSQLQVLAEFGAQAGGRRARGNHAIQRLLGAAAVSRRPDGKPQTLNAHGPDVSVAYAGDLAIAVAGAAPVACDVEAVPVAGAASWGDASEPLAELTGILRDLVDEPREMAFIRAWTTRECLRKAGRPPDAPVIFESREGAWILLRSGQVTVATFPAEIVGGDRPLVFALLAGSAG